ncbi:oxygen-independent coproporphyrinogen III oxidase [Jannaschia marina]|uniref:oxygen-independent coproporphyrinogen III oxidase n=1 Tax=Jannaschia marina TaxID=2741674 RepID=UPI0015CAA9C7|nr:oxygen-independent coproporphyrinogen III oxidase [Jannaschia marina]
MTQVDPKLTARALAARAPRYTSYPPATQFSRIVGESEARTWLGRLPNEPISLYVHVPFCRRLCWFCACRTQGSKTDAPLFPYIDILMREVNLVADAIGRPRRVSHMHLGGGTPTMLPPDLLAQLMARLDARFPRAEGAEMSVEIDPTEIDDARLDAFAAAGMTRASLGVQDFEPEVQAAIGRPQSIAQTRAVVDGARARGVGSLNIDLLYGLPHQTSESLARTLDIVLEMAPDRLALYGYAHVPWASKRQVMIQEDTLPTPVERLDLAARAAATLQEAGYVAVGIDHFARPDDPMARAAAAGVLHRNFQGYTTDASPTLVGLGASSISRLPHGYVQNAAHTAAWAARIADGRLAAARGHRFSADDLLRGAMIERLLCDLAVDPAEFSRPERVRGLLGAAVAPWRAAIDELPGGAIRLPRENAYLARMIAMEIDAYIADEGRHSLAV